MIQYYNDELTTYVAEQMIEVAQRNQTTVHLYVDEQDIYAMATDSVDDILKQYKKRFYFPPLKEMKIIDLDSFYKNKHFDPNYNTIYKQNPTNNIITIPTLSKIPINIDLN